MRQFYFRLLYAGLLVARVLFSVLPSYIHPDEFFQSSEIAANDILKVTGLRTWEFSSPAPVRSIVPIYMYAGTPMFILSFFPVTPWTLFYGSRVFMALLSFAVDLCVYWTIGKKKRVMMLLASSYCLVFFHVHTFSNAFASIVLSVCFYLLKRVESGDDGCFLLGVGLALGSFTHIAFPMFAWPLGLACLATLVSATRSGSLATRGLIARAMGLAAGGVLTAFGLVVADSLYYGSLRWHGAGFPFVSGSLTLTVLNNLSYNSQHDNLAIHGIQPRYFHALANMPLLFGPLYTLALTKLWAFLRSDKQGTGYVGMAAAGSVMSGVALLSLAPHQEARFLLPALPGLVISSWRWHHLASRYFWWMWITFNAALFIVFSMHQAGVVPVVMHLSGSVWTHAQCRYTGSDALCWEEGGSLGVELATKVYLVSTYLAPRHLLAQPLDRSKARARVDLVDLVGREAQEIRDILGGSVHVNETLVRSARSELVFKQTTGTHYERQVTD
ncbi:alpha 1,2 mannosyltransferase [Coemansia sp. RSA 2050]|nr:alpha 1,2 mannosyltransferase [Coemansia sp. RSA 2050]KAJ2731600.1 alpha 1,2 mannosyltransferase [Coemansia sp. BCRC 34962]